jgi:hypothetical protein
VIDPGRHPFPQQQNQTKVTAAWRTGQDVAAKLFISGSRGIGKVRGREGVD